MPEETATAEKSIFTPFNIVSGLIIVIGLVLTVLRFTGGLAAVTNLSDYMGYRLTTILGLEVTRRDFEVEKTQTHTRGFMTVYAGVER